MLLFDNMLTVLNLIVLQNIPKSINLESNIDRKTDIHIFIKGKAIVSIFLTRDPGNPRESTNGVLNFM